MSVPPDEFEVTLPSNVRSISYSNFPSNYETELARCLQLPGEWEVALIDITYSHNWRNVICKITI